MRKLWLFFGLGIMTVLFAQNNVEVYASKIDSNETASFAEGDVLVIYKDYYLSANRARYNRKTGNLELFGNVTAIKEEAFQVLGDYAVMNVKNKEQRFTPFYLLDNRSNVWVSAEDAHAVDRDIDITGGMVSGCNPADPLWRIHFSSSDYDSTDKWMNVYNARLYLYDIPVFYFPYFGYSLDKRRRSGLLTPSLGISSTEGFFYQQSIYIALQDEWDLELRPQIRTERGAGIYGTLRFVDSNTSKGELKAGFFEEQQHYVDTYELAHAQHFGVAFNYENYQFLQKWTGADVKGQTGLYTDLLWMNDVDYLNLAENDETKNVTSNQIYSRINFFYNGESNYVGTYFKYYLDLSKQSNADTIQNLPIVEYHHYLETLLDDHLLYTLNFDVNNYYRETGKKAVQGTVNLPLTLYTSLFNDYLDVSYRAQLHGRYITFSGVGDPAYGDAYQTGMYGRNDHVLDVGTYLTRGFEEVSHTIGLNAVYRRGGGEHRSGYYDDNEPLCQDASGALEPCEYYNIEPSRETTALQLSQYLFDETGRQLLYQRLSQDFSYERDEERLSEFEHELEYQITDDLSFYNNTFYNHQRNLVSKTLNALRYNSESVQIKLDHFYEDQLDGNTSVRSSYMTAYASYRYDRHYRYFAGYAYDFERSLKKRAEIGFLYTKRCWDFGLRYLENRRPILTDNASSSVYDKYIYFTVMLRPIGGSEINYKISDLLEGTQ